MGINSSPEFDPKEGTEVKRLLTGEEIAALHHYPNIRLYGAIALSWLTIILAVKMYAVFGGWGAYILAVFVIATRQHALNVYVHEASHFCLHADKKVNDLICDIFCGFPLGISTQGYRKKHVYHHHRLGYLAYDSELNPRFIINGFQFLVFTVRSLAGGGLVEALKAYYGAIANGKSGARVNVYSIIIPAAVQGVIFALFVLLGSGWYYLTLWFIPLATMTIFIGKLRVIAEHQTLEYSAAGKEDFSGNYEQYSRTIVAPLWERFVFSPINFCYHYEHHLIPSVPYANLPRLHTLLKERGFYKGRERNLGGSYVGVLRDLVFASK